VCLEIMWRVICSSGFLPRRMNWSRVSSDNRILRSWVWNVFSRTLSEALITLMVDTTQSSRCLNAHQMSRFDNWLWFWYVVLPPSQIRMHISFGQSQSLQSWTNYMSKHTNFYNTKCI
jgi:hypothetical protein